jgi:transposase
MSSIPAISSSVISPNSAVEPEQKKTLTLEEEAQLRAYSDRVIVQIIATNWDHLLVRVGQRFDFTEMVELCHRYRREVETRGVEAQYSVEQLVRSIALKRTYAWSYRKTAQQMKTDMLARWFTGFTLHEETPDYTTLQRFEQWVIKHEPRAFFTLVLRQIREDHPEETKAIQFGDTFAMHTRAADKGRTQLLRETVIHLWRTFEVAAEGKVDLDGLQAKLQAVLGGEEEMPAFMLTPIERNERTFVTAKAAAALLTAINEAATAITISTRLTLEAFQRWTQRLEKMLADEFVFEVDEEGRTSVRFCTKKERGSYRMISAVDPEITVRSHGKSIARGFNISVAATVNFVHEIQAATGATPDSVGVSLLIAAQLEHLGTVPSKFVYDQAAGTPKVFYDVAKASGGQTQLVARLVDYHKNRKRFGPGDFSLGEGGLLVCPNGQGSSRAYRSNSGDGWNYRFMPDQCTGCPLMDKCRGDEVKSTSHRQVFISDYVVNQREAIAYTKSDEFKQEMKSRSNIERVIAGVVRYNGAREAEAYGLAQADYQVKMAAMAYNLKRWAALQREKERKERVRTGERNASTSPDSG